MKMIVAMLQPARLEAVKEAMVHAGAHGMTVCAAEGFGEQKGFFEVYRGVPFRVEFVPRVRVECVVPDEKVEAVTEAILEAAYTGKVGDGKIFVLPVEEAIRIRTKERGEHAV